MSNNLDHAAVLVRCMNEFKTPSELTAGRSSESQITLLGNYFSGDALNCEIFRGLHSAACKASTLWLAICFAILPANFCTAQPQDLPPSVNNPDDDAPKTHSELPSDFAVRFQQADNLQIAFIKRLFDLSDEQKSKLVEIEQTRDAVLDELLASMHKSLPNTLARMSLEEYSRLHGAFISKRLEMFAELLTPAQRELYVRESKARTDFTQRANAAAITARMDHHLWLTTTQRESMGQAMSDQKFPPAFNLLLHMVVDSVLPPLPPLDNSNAPLLTADQLKLTESLQLNSLRAAIPAIHITVANAQAVIPVPGRRYQPDPQLAPIMKVVCDLSDPPTFGGVRSFAPPPKQLPADALRPVELKPFRTPIRK